MELADVAKLRIPDRITKHYGIVLPICVMSLLLVILIPLPTWTMDFLLLVNITLSAVVLMTVMYLEGPLEFASGPFADRVRGGEGR